VYGTGKVTEKEFLGGPWEGIPLGFPVLNLTSVLTANKANYAVVPPDLTDRVTTGIERSSAPYPSQPPSRKTPRGPRGRFDVFKRNTVAFES
jgi:hypothetical protein